MNENHHLTIIYEDEWLVAIHKPHGLLVHRTAIAEQYGLYAMLLLRDQLGGAHVYPCHRIDRKTSGVLLFAKDQETLSKVRKLFETNEVEKWYLTMVRGYLPEYGMIDHPLANDRGKLQEARTEYWLLDTVELAIEVSKYPVSRYSLGLVKPHSGRTHQIRRHMAHIRHYIIGDKVHGENKHNRMFRERYDHDRMMLHAWQMKLIHPVTQEALCIKSELSEEFRRLTDMVGLGVPPYEVIDHYIAP